MASLSLDQLSILKLLSESDTYFLIPDYQRPYAWKESECQTLWDDVFSFAFPNGEANPFDAKNKYFLGSIVTFKNAQGKKEVIDGQQRLTTIVLLLRAFYENFGKQNDAKSSRTKGDIASCICEVNEDFEPNFEHLKIESEVATDNRRNELREILMSGAVSDEAKSKYAVNYRFFLQRVKQFRIDYGDFFMSLPIRIMNNCTLLPIEAESQDMALRIFSSLNDRGMPLSDSDIFKAQLYKYYGEKQLKDDFIKRWKTLEERVGDIFHPQKGSPMDELFTHYMYYIRAKVGVKSTTVEALRTFYERDGYGLLKKDETFDNLERLAEFWKSVYSLDSNRFSDDALRRLFVLSYAPNGMWAYLVSVYFLQHKDGDFFQGKSKVEDGKQNDAEFCKFLDLITVFIWAYSFERPGVNALRTPIFPAMINIVNDAPVAFAAFRADELRKKIELFEFKNMRPITKSMLAWWMMQGKGQELPSLGTRFDIEHIYARRRNGKAGTSIDESQIESLGNKALLESWINISASDCRFEDKKGYYEGWQNKNQEGTINRELRDLASEKSDFTEKDIEERKKLILDAFMASLRENGLLSE